jgi:hypothetical protein
MLSKCWACRAPIPMKSHDGQALDTSECPACGTYNPLVSPWQPFGLGLIVVAVLVIMFVVSRT